ncbi:MAG: hypothetical protein AVDCRST_MAG85-42 [uncultured Solirubrobacteraceae bacterium]|uniref:Uncharacterized protein n=1 Tax=uncultured Solirubrobacteraceae bacterium TaxID=1162706 RepID=A0A6J4RIW8_9ACTN|nr:MAG: hypothetical protein AVDCRST_MAG85-42 [uncultured Solirubrobacteraceae bacterium]
MRSQKKMALFGLGGGVALASAAFAVGSQAGGGSAVAWTSTSAAPTTAAAQTQPVHNGGRGGPRHHLSDFAKRLGVEESKLRAALEDLRPDRGNIEDHRAEHVADLARILKLSEARVRAALEKVRPEPSPPGPRMERRGFPDKDAFLATLAKELGVSTETLENAFESLHEQRRSEFAKQLAARLSISPAKVEEVLKELPHPGKRGHR